MRPWAYGGHQENDAMAKILTVDDYPLYAEMVSELLRQHGHHEVKAVLAPVILEEITDFAPDVIVVSLVRRLEAIGHGPLHDFDSEVDGARAWRSIAESESMRPYPVILSVIGVRETEVPAQYPYVALVHIPHELDLLLTTIRKILDAKERGGRLGEA
jgi:CheY-like chemotaxis protein